MKIFLMLFFSINAFAGGSKTGNGGFGLVCTDPKSGLKSFELLDIYEARNYLAPGTLPLLGFPQRSVREEIDSFEYDLRMILPSTHPIFSHFVTAKILLGGLDLDHYAEGAEGRELWFMSDIPANCERIQIASEIARFGMLLLTVRQDYWGAVGNRERALLVLHEMFHDWFMLSPEGNTAEEARVVRHLVGALYLGPQYLILHKDELGKLINRKF